MRLCFDATRFGTGLDGAIELAASKGIGAIEYSIAGAKVSELSSKELKLLKQIRHLSEKTGVSIACLNLDYCLTFDGSRPNKSPRKKNHENAHPEIMTQAETAPHFEKIDKNFSKMLAKMMTVAKTIGCPKLSLSIQPGADSGWLEQAEKHIGAWQTELNNEGINLLLRLATPKENRGRSLKQWITMEPQDWRDLIAACPGLGLSFSPADCVWLGIDYLKILSGIVSGIDHIEAHDIEISRTMLSDSGMYGPLWWRYRLPGKGAVDWTQLLEALKLYGYDGDLSIHLDDEFIADDFQSLEDALDSAIKLFTPLLKH